MEYGGDDTKGRAGQGSDAQEKEYQAEAGVQGVGNKTHARQLICTQTVHK